jgi:AraC-like DNA-binding protein
VNSSVQKPSMGVLNLNGGEKKFQLSRYAPSEEIGFFVKHFWIVSWDLAGQDPYLQDVIPNPCVNMVIEKSRSAIYGAAKNKYSYLIQGKGCVLGVKFKPGGFYPFIKQPVSGLTNNPMEIRDVFDVEAQAIEDAILYQEEEEKMVEFVEGLIRPKLPSRDDNITLINRIIDQIIAERGITRVEDISQRFNINTRKLQRIFGQYVGVSPKWVIQLYRLQNAAEIMDNGQNHDWLKLALDLGYHDQSHFIKDFKAIIGKTPDEYTQHLD